MTKKRIELKNQAAQVREYLLVEKEKIRQRLESLRAQDPYADPERLNDNAASDTEASEESDHERVEALEKELHKRREEIEAVLDRIQKGQYGICKNCRKYISAERLAINPTALYCIACVTHS